MSTPPRLKEALLMVMARARQRKRKRGGGPAEAQILADGEEENSETVAVKAGAEDPQSRGCGHHSPAVKYSSYVAEQ